MLTALSWVPHGRMRAVPLHVNEDTSAAMREKLKRHLPVGDDDDDTLAVARDDDEEDEDVHNIENDDEMFGIGDGGILEQIESDDESEVDDTTFRDTDLVFATVRADRDDDPSLELFVYDEPNDNLYLHHDAVLSAFPLSTAWITGPYSVSSGGLGSSSSMLAVGTMLPYIELWNLDVIDAFEPVTVLGGCPVADDNLKLHKKKGRPELAEGSHTDAVVSLRWNSNHGTVLASGGADSMLKLWDLTQQACVGTYQEPSPHRVQSLDWHPTEAHLLMAAVGPTLSLRDCRTPTAEATRWDSNGETLECCRWSFHDHAVFASTSGGSLCAFDARKGSQSAPLWHLSAHGSELTFDVSRHAPLLATGGKDGYTSLWSMAPGTENAPKAIASRKLGVGQSFCIQFHPNSADVVAACGSNGRPLVYTITSDVAGKGQQHVNPATTGAQQEESATAAKARKGHKSFKKGGGRK